MNSVSMEKHQELGTGKQSVTPLDSNVMTAMFTTPASSPTLSNELATETITSPC